MPGVLDALSTNAFGVVALTEAINLAPVIPNQISKDNMFEQKGVDTNTVLVEFKNGQFAILPTAVRGTLGTTQPEPGRVARSFDIPHIPHKTEVNAHEIMGVRKFGGTGDDMETMQERITDHIELHANSHHATWEYHMAGALCGNVLDADGTTSLYNLYTLFGLTQDVFTFNFSAGTEAVLHAKALEVKQAVQNAMGAQATKGVSALVDDVFFSAMIASAGVRSAWSDYQSGDLLRKGFDMGEDVFFWGGIKWRRYRATAGALNFFGSTNVARFYPEGATGLLKHYMGPANFASAVNTIGLPMYASQERLPHDMGVQLHSQSNPLFICTRPNVLKKGVST